ncbi:hypothetical protein FRC10_008300 [Ceratobasidium sp. 414]|nr:hypothetical protein FRC10_008300 [Ceratobasidium sp. 414]
MASRRDHGLLPGVLEYDGAAVLVQGRRSPQPFLHHSFPVLAPRNGLSLVAASPGTPAVALPTPLRRNSMPIILMHPPTYKEFYLFVPCKEGGKEKPPPHSWDPMLHKMEFTAPGMLAKDRAWKPQYIVPHGTSLFIYKHNTRKQPIGGKVNGKEWYEVVVTEDEVGSNSLTVKSAPAWVQVERSTTSNKGQHIGAPFILPDEVFIYGSLRQYEPILLAISMPQQLITSYDPNVS